MFNATLRNMGGPTGNAQDGIDAAGVTPPAGADGIRGWLSGIYNKLSGTLTVALSSSSPLDVSDRSARLLGHVTVDNTISVGSDVTDRAGRLLGHVTVDSAPTTAVTGTFWQTTQPVSGAVSVTGTVPVTGTFWQVTQPISGSVSVSNFPATQPVSGTFWQATQPVSLATNTPDVTDRAGRLLGHVTVDSAPTTAVTGTFFPATQPVSATALPLPAGAATDGTDITTPTAMPAGGAGIRGWLSAIWTKLNGTLAVTGTFFQATQPVSLATNTPDVTDRAARLLGHVTVDAAPTTAVTGTFFQATQPVSGTVTAGQGTAAAVAGAWPVKNTDGTNTATVTPASTAAAAANSGLVVALHPTSPLPAGSSVIGALTANQSVNNAQVNGSAVVTSVTGVQDVMPRKRTGSTGLSPNYTASHITTNATTTPTSATAYISTILITVSGAGTAWTIKIQNKEATPKIIYPVTTAVVGTPIQLNFNEPILATSGIDIITGGTTAGVADVFVTYWQ